ncbi:MAG: GHKL domain-containing protein [Coprobacillus sp.]
MKEKLNTFNTNLLVRSALLLILSIAFLYSAVIVLLESTQSYQFLLIFMELIGMTFLLFSISKEYKQTQKNVLDLKQQEQLIHMKNENQEIKAQNDIDIMHIRHEMKNQILTLEYLLKEQKYHEASEFITGLHTDVLYKKSVDTNNEVINAICNNKIYHHPDIHFDFQFQFNQLNIDNHDLISLIGNTLDNAIEYLSHHNNDKNISLSIQQTTDFYIFVIKNTIQDSIDINNIKTTKQDNENHGFGLTIIKNIVEKHQGTFEISVGNNEFIVSLLIPIASIN